MLTLSDSGRLQLERRAVDLRELAEDVVSAHRVRAERAGVELSTSGTAVAAVDARRMRQVLGNLVDNAIRHTPSAGSVSISVRRTADGVDVAVADTGEGIPTASVDRIFDRFARADEHRGRDAGGTGLGLAIVSALVQAHDGVVSVESEVAVGTTFTVSLPAD